MRLAQSIMIRTGVSLYGIAAQIQYHSSANPCTGLDRLVDNFLAGRGDKRTGTAALTDRRLACTGSGSAPLHLGRDKAVAGRAIGRAVSAPDGALVFGS